MKKIRKLRIVLLTILLLFQFEPMKFEASSTAAFYVQTAAVLEDNTIEICVYLDEADNIGGIDLELVYDTEKVSFVSSSLGPSLQSPLSDIYHEEENGEIHYVIIYSKSKSAHGILLRATFQLKEGESYQPQLVVNDLLDNSVEINEIPYTITYQQADGTWMDTQDMSGEVGGAAVIEETLEKYGAPEDLKGDDKKETISIDRESNISGTIADTESSIKSEHSDRLKDVENVANDNLNITYLVIGFVVLFGIVFGITFFVKLWKKRG